MDSVIELLEELLLYMEKEYDADVDQDGYIPNEEMYFGVQIERAIKLLKTEMKIQSLKKEIENV